MSYIAIQSAIRKNGVGLEELAFTRKELKPLEARLSPAQKITITGGSLYRLSDEYYAFFESKLKNGCQLEIIMVKPYSYAANLLCDKKYFVIGRKGTGKTAIAEHIASQNDGIHFSEKLV